MGLTFEISNLNSQIARRILLAPAARLGGLAAEQRHQGAAAFERRNAREVLCGEAIGGVLGETAGGSRRGCGTRRRCERCDTYGSAVNWPGMSDLRFQI